MGRPDVCTDSEAVLKWLLAEANWRINILATTLYKEKIGRNPKGDTTRSDADRRPHRRPHPGAVVVGLPFLGPQPPRAVGPASRQG